MAQEKTTIARPYAEAVFSRARETNEQDLWSETLGMFSTVVRAPEISGLIDNPKIPREQVLELMLEIGTEMIDCRCYRKSPFSTSNSGANIRGQSR